MWTIRLSPDVDAATGRHPRGPARMVRPTHAGLRRVLRPVLALSIMAVACLVGNAAYADTDGPGPPVTDWSGCGPANAYGPCTDPQKWTHVSGVGNGLCGRCGDKTFSRSTGTCTGAMQHQQSDGGDSGVPGEPGEPSEYDNPVPVPLFDCKNCICSASCTYYFKSTPVGALEFAGCVAATAAMLAADVACGIACGGVCIVSGVFTLGASCVACLAGCGAAGAAIICFYNECVEDCNYTGYAFAGSVPCCTQ